MSETNDSLAKEKETLKSVENAPTSEKLLTYTKLSAQAGSKAPSLSAAAPWRAACTSA